MYAVIVAGGHQYRVAEGDTVVIDRMDGNEGDKVTFDKVLMLGGAKTAVGAPLVAGAKVEATIKRQFRDEKIIVFKYKRKKNYQRKKGHRQQLTEIQIGKIVN
jgi:large subunit ribosomal protein L21